MPTIRKEILQALEQGPLTLREISQLFGVTEKEALEHLAHIVRSAGPKRFQMAPARCNTCGFSFKTRTRLNTPGRCPMCRSESIVPPRFQINP
jgi:predicted Zn-ribbon and HTH transcriptional regulator